MNITAPLFGEEEIATLRECLSSGWVTQGPFTARFERLFMQRHDVTHALATTSCTAALHLATLALGLREGDEVVVPAFTWVTSAHCAEYVGARAVFADIDPGSFNLDPAALEAAITPRTRAIVAVHLFGLAAPMDEISSIASRHGLKVIEDAACAIGTTYRGRPVGGMSDIACFSFHPRKVITTGEGGMVTTTDPTLAAKVQSYRNHGATGISPGSDPSKPWVMATFNNLGFNLRLSDIQAAVGVAQMARLDGILAERAAAAARYLEMLSVVEELALPRAPDGYGHTYQSFVVRLRHGGRNLRNSIMDHLASQGIQTRPGTHAVHRLGYYAEKYGIRPEQFAVAAASEDTTITLPIFPGMTIDQQSTVVRMIKQALAK